MSDLLKNIDARTRLAGTNKLEILLFSLGKDNRTGRCETFGINVFKVREVMRTPPITSAPEMPTCVKGMVSLRGILVPVVDLAEYIGVQSDMPRDIMIMLQIPPPPTPTKRNSTRPNPTSRRVIIFVFFNIAFLLWGRRPK